MKKNLICVLVILMLFSGCNLNDNIEEKKPQPMEKIEVATTAVTNNLAKETSHKERDFNETFINEYGDIYRESYYGIPVYLDDEAYQIPALKIANYFFIDFKTVCEMFGLTYTIEEEYIKINSDNLTPLNKSSLIKGSLTLEAIASEELEVMMNDNLFGVTYRNQMYIALPSINEILENKLYMDRDSLSITNKKITYDSLPETNNSLLRKRVILNENLELVVKDGTFGKMLVVNNVYGSSMDITPNNSTTFSTDYQNIFLHKKDDKLYMFGLLSNSIDVYNIVFDGEEIIEMSPLGFIQRQAQNIYYIKDKYLAIGRNDIFGIEINEDVANDRSLIEMPQIIETNGILNTINSVPYLTARYNKDNPKLGIFRFNPTDFSFTLVNDISVEMTFNETPLNFMYSYKDNDNILTYAMDDTGYIYELTYYVNYMEVSKEKTNSFKLFYQDSPFIVDFHIELVEAENEGESELQLVINDENLGNKIVAYGVEDDWVYCSEYVHKDGVLNVYGFRYNVNSKIRDY